MMKASLKKLRGFSVHKNDTKTRNDRHLPLPQLDELAQASQDMLDMRDCYDSLLSAAAATANSAYEFSESLREMGACLLEKTALNDDEESGKVLLMLGKLQFELQKLVDSYRSHIFQTITSPSESLLNELRTVEEMKRQCDEKRSVYEYMLTTQKDQGRSRTGKGDTATSQQLQEAHDEYDEEATLFIFRLKSLKKGQCRSLLTQAARHHAAQLHFFKNALKSLETVDPHVKYVTEQQHIDYQFTEFEENVVDDEYDDNDDDSSGTLDDEELSFDYGQNEDNQNAASNSMELDQVDLTFPTISDVTAIKDTAVRKKLDLFGLNGEMKKNSQSAPLFPDKKRDSTELLRKLQPSSTRKLHTYVLPTPDDTKSSVSSKSGNLTLPVRQFSLTRRTNNSWHSSPLEPSNYDKSSRQSVYKPQSVLKESNQNMENSHLPPSVAHGLRFPHIDPYSTSDSKKIKRQSFSGPLMGKESSTKPLSHDHLQLFSGPLTRNPMPTTSSPKVSPTRAPSLSSSPKISELHELPRPPVSYTSSYSRSSVLVGHSAPLVSRGQELLATKKMGTSSAASPLPIPPRSISRSFSIPSNSGKAPIPKPLQSPGIPSVSKGVPLHPLTPVSQYDDNQTGQSIRQENLSRGAERTDS